MSERVFPLRKAYSYVIAKDSSMHFEVDEIKATRVEDRVYGGTSQYRRAKMIRLLKENGWWRDFCMKEWPEAFTPKGQDIIDELRSEYPYLFIGF
jgi:hypothetical protein